MQDLKAIRFIEGTKISHDYDGDRVDTFSYRDLCERNSPAIGIPCRQNNLIIIDVDVEGETHKHDGREFWANFSAENGMPLTYTVRTPSGGYHFYFRLPASMNPETFTPPGQLAPGVDVKWNGWAGAPPTPGYTIHYGNLTLIQDLPASLIMYMAELHKGKPSKTFDVSAPNNLTVHRPFSEIQIRELKSKIEWAQANGTLSRQEWRDGLFALKAGIDDPDLLDELLVKWTMNRAYAPGDEEQAREIVSRANKHGPIGPGSIFAILKNVAIREGAPAVETPFTNQEILDRSRVAIGFNKDGSLKIEPSESNAAALIGATFDDQTLYHDVRNDMYVFQGKSYSEVELTNMFIPLIQSPAFGLGLEKFRGAAIARGVEILLAKRRRDTHVEYLNRLEWDGVKRIERFFVDYVGAEETEYTKLVGLNFWVSLAARGMRPGCKFDTMVVIEGDEGIAKSSLIEAIGGKYTYATSNKKALSDLDSLRQMHQSVIVELPELMGLVGMDSESVKAFFSRAYDTIRALYSKKAVRNERGFVMVGTTNSTKYLAMTMGARRFWPVRVPSGKVVNLAGIQSDRDQLFAEAIERYKQGHPFYHMPKELLAPVIESRQIGDPLVGALKEMLPTFGSRWTVVDAYRRLEAGGVVQRGLTFAIGSRIEDALKGLGCVQDGDYWMQKPSMMETLQNFVTFSGSLDSLI